MNTGKTTKTQTAAIATIVAVVAAVPAMFGALLSIGDVDVLSPDCDQDSQQAQVGILSKLLFQSSSQNQDCDSVDIL
jgi:hypothetical protein